MKTFIVTAIAALTLTVIPAAFAQDTAKAHTPAYMIGSYDIRDEAGFQKYIAAAAPLVSQYGGRVIVYNPGAKAIVEGEPRSVIAVAEYRRPSA
jgi:hypothetical protein